MREKDDYPNSNQSKLQDTLSIGLQRVEAMCRLLASELHSRHAFALDCLAASYRNKGLLVRVLLTTSNGPVLATWHPCSRQHSVPKIRESGGLLGLSAGTFSPSGSCGFWLHHDRAAITSCLLQNSNEYFVSIDSFHQRPRQNWFPKGVAVLRAVMNLDTQTRVLG